MSDDDLTDLMTQRACGRCGRAFTPTKDWPAFCAGCAAMIVRWNDAPGRTHAEVLAAFDRAIAAGGGA